MRTSLFIVLCSLTAVFACGGGRKVIKSDTETVIQNVIKTDSSASAKSVSTTEETNIAVWDNETILEIYGDDISVNKYDGSDSTPNGLEPIVKNPDGSVVVSLTHGKLLVSGNVKRITHKSKGKDSANTKTFSLDTSSVANTSRVENKTETATKTKETTKEPMQIPWGGIVVLGGILFLVYILIRKAFL